MRDPKRGSSLRSRDMIRKDLLLLQTLSQRSQAFMNTLADPGTCTEWVVSEVGIEEKVLMGREVVRELGVSVWKRRRKRTDLSEYLAQCLRG